MRRLVIASSAAALLLLGGALGGSSLSQARAPASAPTPTEGHPLVGAWMITVEDIPGPPTLAVIGADGTYVDKDPNGATGFGAWEATGPTSAALTFVSMTSTEDGGFEPIVTIRANIEVSDDGQSFTAQFTIELDAEGLPTGEFGPGVATGTRISVEPMGTPVGTLEDLFAFEEGTAPPEEVPTTAPAEVETTVPLEVETTVPAEETTVPAEEGTTVPLEVETTVPLEIETTLPPEVETTVSDS